MQPSNNKNLLWTFEYGFCQPVILKDKFVGSHATIVDVELKLIKVQYVSDVFCSETPDSIDIHKHLMKERTLCLLII